MPATLEAQRKQQWHTGHAAFFAHELQTPMHFTQRTYVYDSTSTLTSQRSLLRPVSPSQIPSPAPSCTLCLESLAIRDGEPPQALPCGHIFHFSCITQWLGLETDLESPIRNYCPSCKQECIKILRPVWYDPSYNNKYHFENGDVLIYQNDGFVSFWRERGILEYELTREEVARMLGSRSEKGKDMSEEARYVFWDFVDSPNPFNSYGRFPNPAAELDD